MNLELLANRLSHASRSGTGRILELDALRAIAAINLLLFHYTLVFPNKYGFHTPLGFELPYGKYGVQLFFMLSGFVNAMTLLKKRDPREFLASRFIRILPSYWLLLVINAILFSSFAMYGVQVTAESALANMTVMPNLFGFECWEPVTWTLQVEMLFYGTLMFLFMGGALANAPRTCLMLLGISAGGIFLVDQWTLLYPGSTLATTATFVSELMILRYLPLFVIGILLHQIWSGLGDLRRCALGIVTAAFIFHWIDNHDHNPVVTVLLFGLLAMSAWRKLPILRFKPFMFISATSYSLYLFHNNLGCLLIRYVHDAGLSPLASITLAFAFSIAVGAVVTYWYERPISAFLRKRWTALKQTRWLARAEANGSVASNS